MEVIFVAGSAVDVHANDTVLRIVRASIRFSSISHAPGHFRSDLNLLSPQIDQLLDLMPLSAGREDAARQVFFQIAQSSGAFAP